MTQQHLADASGASLGAVRKIERGERSPSEAMVDAFAEAMGIDSSRLRHTPNPARTPVHDALPLLSAGIAAYDVPDDGPIRPLRDLRTAVNEASRWRLAAQYTRIARKLPELLAELARAYHAAYGSDRAELLRTSTVRTISPPA
ncbi:helix-turn-helix domain-containing protein [Streptomyces sp. NPDC088387]|uniref:helix-turn-helix domain-containing protein n=1 Tax=Streptomyces sp. NPDC088387 TaxID=3365859 RepID=UPI0037F79D1A